MSWALLGPTVWKAADRRGPNLRSPLCQACLIHAQGCATGTAIVWGRWSTCTARRCAFKSMCPPHFNWGEHQRAPPLCFESVTRYVYIYIYIDRRVVTFLWASPVWRQTGQAQENGAQSLRTGPKWCTTCTSSRFFAKYTHFAIVFGGSAGRGTLLLWNGGWSIRLAALREELRRSKVRLEPWSSGHYRLLSRPGQAWEVLCVALCGGPLFDPACVMRTCTTRGPLFLRTWTLQKPHWAGFVRFALRDRFPGTCRSGGRWLCVCVLSVLDVLDAYASSRNSLQSALALAWFRRKLVKRRNVPTQEPKRGIQIWSWSNDKWS